MNALGNVPLDENAPPMIPGSGWMVIPPDESLPLDEVERHVLKDYPPGTSVTIIRRYPGGWGSRLTIEESYQAKTDTEPPAAAQPDSQPSSGSSVLEPIVMAGMQVGYVELSGGPDFGAQALAAAQRALLIAGSGAVLLAGLLGLFISRRLAAPLVVLSQAAGRMGAGDLTTRAEVRTRDETGALAASFNQMAERLEASFNQLTVERDALKRFISDASHELRTPITALKNFISLLQGPASADPRAQVEFLAESQAQIHRLEWITQNLLDLSRLDAGLAPLELAEVSASDLLEASAAPFRLTAVEKGIALEVRLPQPDFTLRCDHQRMEMALTNLLDNAMKFTPPGGRIELGAEASANGARLWVQDNGAGIAAQDLPHVFERFYTRRAIDHSPAGAGSGLGLSIVERIVQDHGGEVQVESEPGHGSSFTITL
jgi:signal transduction histidine kinase